MTPSEILQQPAAGNSELNVRPDYDLVIQDIADYVLNYRIAKESVLEDARHCLVDSIGCGLLALGFPECVKLLGPFVPGTVVPGGSRVPGTRYCLDPVKAAWDIGAMIRWLDYNDTWLAAEWGHPSDNLGAILSVGDYVSKARARKGGEPFLMREVLEYMIKAHEIQGVIALKNAFNRVGLDHVILVRVASTAVAIVEMSACSTIEPSASCRITLRSSMETNRSRPSGSHPRPDGMPWNSSST